MDGQPLQPLAEVCLGFSGQIWPQYPEEINGFMAFLVEQGCRSYMEIGCRYGDTFHAVGMALPEGSKLLAVDLPGAKAGIKNNGGHRDSDKYLKRAVADLRAHGRDAHVIFGDSHEQKTIARVADLSPFDALLIDGDHTAQGVSMDLTNYGPMARLVAFHDICGQGKWARQIRPIFEKFAKGKRSVRFEYDGLRRGIGVVWND